MRIPAPLQALAILLLSLAAAAITWAVVDPPAVDKTCDPSSLPENHICLESISDDQPVVWVDARSRHHWQTDGVKDSVLWNLDATEDTNAFERELFMRVANHSAEQSLWVIVYCHDKQCGTSERVAKQIRTLDLPVEVRVLHGGWSALEEAGKVQDK